MFTCQGRFLEIIRNITKIVKFKWHRKLRTQSVDIGCMKHLTRLLSWKPKFEQCWIFVLQQVVSYYDVPVYASSPKPVGNPIDPNHNYGQNLPWEKTFPQLRILDVLATDPLDDILSSTPSKSHYQYYHTQIWHAKNGPRGELARFELLPILGADWFIWFAFLRLDWFLENLV